MEHRHINTKDGELPAEEMAQMIKKSSNSAILKEFPFLGEKFGNGIQIWDPRLKTGSSTSIRFSLTSEIVLCKQN